MNPIPLRQPSDFGWFLRRPRSPRVLPPRLARCRECNKPFTILSGQLVLHPCPATGSIRTAANIP